MVVDKLLAFVVLATVANSFYIGTSNGALDEPIGIEYFDMVINDTKVDNTELSTASDAFHEQGLTKNYEIKKPLLLTWLLEKNLPSIRNNRSVHRQKRASGLRRFFSRRKGSKKISRKQLPLLLARIKAIKKARKRKAKELITSNEMKQLDTLKSTIPADRDTNPSSTNEINLTVHVDMNEQKQISESNKKKDLDSLGRSRAFHTVDNNYPNYPFASSNFQIPQTSSNILGIHPQLGNPFQNNLVQGNFAGPNGMSPRRYPVVDGSVSRIYPNQRVENTRPAPVPVFSDPRINSRLVDKYYKNDLKLSDDIRAFPMDDRAVLEKYPIQDNLNSEHTQSFSVSNPIHNSARSDEVSKTERQHKPSKISKIAFSDDNANLQRPDEESTLQKESETVTAANPGQQLKNASHDHVIENNMNLDTLSISENTANKDSVSSSSELRHKADDGLEKSEIKELLKDIQSKVSGLTPLLPNNQKSFSSDSERKETKEFKTHILSKASQKLKQVNIGGNDNQYSTNTSEKSFPSKDMTANDKTNLEKISNPAMNEIMPKHVSKSIDHAPTAIILHVKEKTGFPSSRISETGEINSVITTATAQNTRMSNEVITHKDQNKLNQIKLQQLESGAFLKTLQKLKMISDREIEMLKKMSPKWEKEKNKINMIFSQLMRRKYFRDNVEKLLESVPTGDIESNTELILSLIDLEEEISHTKGNIPFTGDQSGLKTKSNSIFQPAGNMEISASPDLKLNSKNFHKESNKRDTIRGDLGG